MYYLNARMYDPKTARFLQQDTYSGDQNDPLSLNLYTYCANNPLIYYDPTGHKWMDSAREWFLNDTAAGRWVDKNIVKPVENKAKDIYNYIDEKAPAVTAITEALYDEAKTICDTVDIVDKTMEAVKVITHPKESINQIKDNYVKIFSDPKKTWNSIANRVTNYVDTNIINGNTHTRAEFGTHAVVFVASFFVGAGEVKAAKTGLDGVRVAEESISMLSRFKNSTSTITNKLLTDKTGSTNLFNKMFSGLGNNEIKELQGVNRGLEGTSELARGKTYWHVTSDEIADAIVDTQKLGKPDNSWEARAFAWTKKPTRAEAKAAGIGGRSQSVVEFRTNASFEPDAGIVNFKIKNYTVQTTDAQRVPFDIFDAKKVDFQKRWWKFWKK